MIENRKEKMDKKKERDMAGKKKEETILIKLSRS
jgi:hypothetical protein